MAAKSTTFSNDELKLIYNAIPIANIADNAASSPLTNIYLALHTADPTAAGNQSSSEVAYTGYARLAVARSTSGFTVSGNAVTLAAQASFPTGTGGSGTATYFSTGVASTGATKILHWGTISPSIVCGNGVQPFLATGTSITES